MTRSAEYDPDSASPGRVIRLVLPPEPDRSCVIDDGLPAAVRPDGEVAIGVHPSVPGYADEEIVEVADSTIDLNRVVVAAVAGDSTALNTVLSEVRPLIWRYCRSRIGRPDRSAVSVDDVAQEILMAVVKAIPSYENVGRPFLAFVYGIARNKVADAHRAATRNRADPVETLPDTLEVGDGPEAILMADEQSKRMAELLAVLPAKQREIIRLRIVLGLSAEDTAAAVGSTAGAVRVAQHRALNKLRGHPLLRQLTE